VHVSKKEYYSVKELYSLIVWTVNRLVRKNERLELSFKLVLQAGSFPTL